MYIEVGRHRRQLKIEAINAIARQQQAEAAQASRPSPVAASKAAKTSANQFWKKSAAEAVTLRQPGTKRPPDQKTGETPEKNKHKGGP